MASSGEVTPALRPSRAGSSIVAPYAPQITQWLREYPDLSGAEILRLAGYCGGKSAFYELVRRLRVGASGGFSPTSATGTGWERTRWHAVQRAVWAALRRG